MSSSMSYAIQLLDPVVVEVRVIVYGYFLPDDGQPRLPIHKDKCDGSRFPL